MTELAGPKLVPGSGPQPVDAVWVAARVQAILAAEPFIGRPTSICWLEVPEGALPEDGSAATFDRRLPVLALSWPENNDGWSDEMTFAIPAGGDVSEYLEAVRDPLGI